ncbi:borealin isoform 1-T1 [Vipera latastei]
MAPGKKRATARGAPKTSARDKRIDAFLKDFDREVKARVARVRAEGESLKKEVEDMFNMELLRLPVVVREMNWLDFYALGDDEQALEKMASNEVDIAEINELASRAVQTPFRVAKKAKQDIETIDEEMETSLLPAVKKSRQEDQADLDVAHQKAGKAQTSSKGPPNSKRTRPPSTRSKHFSKSRLTKVNPVTPAGQGNPAKAATPLLTPAGKFDSSVFKTPGLRAPAAHERVFSISANGSPLADRSEVFLTVPLGGGENMRIRASELSEKDLRGLNAQALGSVKKLSSQLSHLCSRVGSHK